MEIRSFLAFELPREMKDTVSRMAAEMRILLPGARWVRAQNIHLTIVFLGQIPSSSAEKTAKIAKSVCDRYGAFEIALKGIGLFSGLRNPRVLWIGLQGDLERMSHFKAALERKLEPFGAREEKRVFRPHLTLCRFKKGFSDTSRLAGLLDHYSGFSGPSGKLDQLSFFKSDLTPRGSIYTRLKEWPLSGKR